MFLKKQDLEFKFCSTLLEGELETKNVALDRTENMLAFSSCMSSVFSLVFSISLSICLMMKAKNKRGPVVRVTAFPEVWCSTEEGCCCG